MNASLIPIALFCCSLAVIAADSKADGQALRKADSVVWAGIDYSLVRMYGTQDFNDTDKIFPEMFEAWNALFVSEPWAERVGKTLGKKVIVDIGGMSERNKLAKPDQVIREDGTDALLAETHITEKDIAKAIRSYTMREKAGVGLVFVVDRFVSASKKGSLHIVLFDVEKREVLASQRGVYRAAGFGFRNFWFGVVKQAIPDVKKLQ